MPMLQSEEVSVRFGGLNALAGISFHLSHGEALGLMGPNGAGKSTLLNLISGFVSGSGRIVFEGHSLVGLSPQRIAQMGIARTFQHPRPFLDLTVKENVELALHFGARRPNRHPSLATATGIIAFCQLENEADVLTANLTAVKHKQLEIARALGCRPHLLLLDEPLQGLNPVEAAVAGKLVRRIQQELNVAVLMVEHNVKALLAVSDRVMVLSDGRLIAEGNPTAVSRNKEVIQAYLGEDHFERPTPRVTATN